MLFYLPQISLQIIKINYLMHKRLKLRASIGTLIEEGLEFYDEKLDKEIISMSENVKAKGFATLKDLEKISYWKSPRSHHHIQKNINKTIKDITGEVLNSNSDLINLSLLLLLHGVSYPTASAFLHFCHELDYPIVDFRAMWSVGFDDQPKYTPELWIDYVLLTRKISKRYQIDKRTLDRALWGYTKKYQTIRD